MSAFTIGAGAYRSDRAKAEITVVTEGLAPLGPSALEEVQLPAREDAFAEIIKWVPGELIAGYGAVIAAATAGTSRPGGAVAWLFVALAGAWIFLSGATEWLKLGSGVSFRWGQTVTRALLGAAAFLIWSFAVPGSPSRSWELVAGIDEAVLSVVVVLSATLFGMVAALVVGLMDRYRPTW